MDGKKIATELSMELLKKTFENKATLEREKKQMELLEKTFVHKATLTKEENKF